MTFIELVERTKVRINEVTLYDKWELRIRDRVKSPSPPHAPTVVVQYDYRSSYMI